MTKINKLTDNRMNFPIRIEGFKQTQLDPTYGAIEQWVCTANNYVIAHFLDETSLYSYMEFLKNFGFRKFPKNVVDIIAELGKNSKHIKIG